MLGHCVPVGTIIYTQCLLDSATLHLGRGIRPIDLSPNILTRASSHRIFVLCLHCSLLSEYYSITEATRPDPTVRPPSRYQTGILLCANGNFSYDLWRKIRIFRCVRVVFMDFVIMVLSPNVRYSYYALCGNIFLISSTSLPGSEPFL